MAGPPYGAISTGSASPPGRCQDGSSSAVRICRSPTDSQVTCGKIIGSASSEASGYRAGRAAGP